VEALIVRRTEVSDRLRQKTREFPWTMIGDNSAYHLLRPEAGLTPSAINWGKEGAAKSGLAEHGHDALCVSEPSFVTCVTADCVEHVGTSHAVGGGALQMRTQTFPVDHQLAAQVACLGRSIVVAKGTPLFKQGGEPLAVYVLQSGAARLTLADKRGIPRLKLTAAAGTILGLPAVFANLPYSLSAELTDASDVVVISSGLLLDAARQDGKFCLRLLRLLGEEVHAVRRLIPSPFKRRRVRC
jgi:hypothetical protein